MTFIEQVTETEPWSGARRPFGKSQVALHEAEAPARMSPGLLAHGRRLTLLNRVVEAEILPRLALVRSGAPATSAGEPNLTTRDDTAHLVTLLIGFDAAAAPACIDALQARGLQPAALFLGIITDAARLLGEMWLDDRCTFAEVTIGVGRLQQIVRALTPAFQQAAMPPSTHPGTVLLLPAPGEQHTFGLVILGEFFQREGWHVLGGPASSSTEAAGMVRDAWIDVVGFSAGSTSRVETLAATIHAVRQASRNRDIGVMVGGPLFLERPELVSRVGADTTAADAPAAVRQARTLLAMRAAAD